MFYRPIRSAIADERHAGVLTGMWHLITIHFVLSALALFVLAARGGRGDAAAWLIAAQFAAYAAVYLVVSLRLGGALTLFPWIPSVPPQFSPPWAPSSRPAAFSRSCFAAGEASQ